jgi:hypothetical protein
LLALARLTRSTNVKLAESRVDHIVLSREESAKRRDLVIDAWAPPTQVAAIKRDGGARINKRESPGRYGSGIIGSPWLLANT